MTLRPSRLIRIGIHPSIYYLNSPHCSPCTQITLRNQLFCDFQVHSRSWKFLHTSLVWKFDWFLKPVLHTSVLLQPLFSWWCLVTLFTFEWHSGWLLLKSSCHSSLFKCFQLLSFYKNASCWNFNYFFTNSAFVWLFSTVHFQMSPQISRITLFLKILWLNILAVSEAFTQCPYQAQRIHKKLYS